ncbi:MAG: glutamine--tRNA ligase/YqeY domain fusion protein [Spirochaetales bacterium]|jgi:glutaminyl-tRNA synthetase|nr:glutamine--tRNA ligase/YqeY domain fusion protein [Spirochaetales bacterium]
MSDTQSSSAPAGNFIRDIIDKDRAALKNGGRVVTRFPPEPNGYLHIGHAKSIWLNFGIARDYQGRCNLRFDDTNPAKEEQEYIDSIEEDVRWLGYRWSGLFFASDYFERMYGWAEEMIRKGLAYVDDLSAEEIREQRGTLTQPGRESPFRGRSVEENLDLFRRMRGGEFPDGFRTLRARIDMASPNLNLRDPVMYRILRAEHPRQGNKWLLYPMYDWAHGLEDSIEGVTHSICTLEFEDHRPLYNWFLENLEGVHRPQQIEFARLNLSYTVMSKRKLLKMVQENLVEGWDDPRMPTISGFRRRGYTPEAIRDFCDRIGVAKVNSTVDFALLEHCLREHLNKTSPRVMAVLRPLKLIIDNYPEGQVEWLEAENNPEDPGAGKRSLPFSRELYIEADDFTLDPPKKYYRLAPGREIRLKHGYYVTYLNHKTNAAGEVTEVHCTYDPASRGGWTQDGRNVKGTSHWVSLPTAVPITVRLYKHLFTAENPGQETGDFLDDLDPESLTVLDQAVGEPCLAKAPPETRFQFLRQGYFVADRYNREGAKPVFNRTAGLKDSWAKTKDRQGDAG